MFADQVVSKVASLPRNRQEEKTTVLPVIIPERNRARPGWHKPPGSTGHFQSPNEVAKGKKKSSLGCKTNFVPNVPHKRKLGRMNRSLMRPAAWMDLHPFAPTLHKWEKGVPVDCGDDWSREAIDLAI
eukprot:scaffold198964_cov41-Attheya_sp.AAC.2